MTFIDRTNSSALRKKKYSGTGKFTCAKIPKVTRCKSFYSTLYNRQRRQLLFLVCLQVSEKNGVMKENCWDCWTVVLVVVHRVFYSHFIISFKKYDVVAKTFLYIIIILCFVNKLIIVVF
jgi:hypothetical protein